MGYQWSNGGGRWNLWGDIYAVRETEYGSDRAQLVFPGISTCAAIATYSAAAGFHGVHLAQADPEADVARLFARLAALSGGAASHILFMGALRQLGRAYGRASDYCWPGVLTHAADQFSGGRAVVRGSFLPPGGDFDYRVSLAGGQPQLQARPTANAAPGDGQGWQLLRTEAI